MSIRAATTDTSNQGRTRLDPNHQAAQTGAVKTGMGILKDASRFKAIRRNDALWLFDERDLGFHAIDGGIADFILAAVEGEPLPPLSNDDREALSLLMDELETADELPAPQYRSNTRIGNLKLALSNRCPSACAYCFRPGESASRPREGIIRDALRVMVEDFGSDSDVLCVSFNLTSEPLADLEQLGELERVTAELRKETGKKFTIYFCTSGLVQSEEAKEAIYRTLEGYRLPVSIDGPRDVHDRYRRDAFGRGTYDRVMALVAWAKDRNLSLEAQAVLTRSYPYPHLVLEHLLDLDFDSVSMKPVRAGFESAIREDDLPVLEESYDHYFEALESALLRDDTALLDILKHDYALRPLWKLALKVKAESRCIWGTSHIVMDACGDFYPCDSVIGDAALRCGSLDGGIDFAKFHADVSWRAREGCQACWARTLCGGTCYVNGLALAGNHLAIDPVECALTKYFAERCIGLMISLIESGRNPSSIGEILLAY